MVAVRMLVAVGGRMFSWRPGQVVDLPGAEAAKWADGVRGQYAETTTAPRPVTPVRPRPETTTDPAPERTTSSSPAKSTRRTAATGRTAGKRGR